MRFTPIFLVGLMGLANSVIADKLVTVEGCDADIFVSCGLYYSDWHTDFGVYRIDGHSGCRKPNVPGMTNLCVDWNAHRGHFQFSHQNFKRCFTQRSRIRFTDDACWGLECWRAEWLETACTWREIPGEEVGATVSVSGLPSNITEATASAPAATAFPGRI
jgi:hypothetical protein